MAKVILAIGNSGGGKTTAMKPFAEKNNYLYLSADEIRKELTGNEEDQFVTGEAWSLVRKRMVKALNSNKDVVVDGTFAKGEERRRFVEYALRNGARRVQGVLFNIDLETAVRRQLSRDRQVPKHALKRMDAFLEKDPVSLEDGFESLFVMNSDGNLEKIFTNTTREKTKEFRFK
jgi:predicted kinase